MAATGTALKDYSTTPGSNGPSGTADPPSTLDDSLRNIASVIRYRVGTHGSIASAATCDIGTKEERSLAVTGTTTITSFGTSLGSGGYGIVYELTFDGILTLTHSSALSCISSANITTAAGDSCAVRYSSTGWTMLWYVRKSGEPVAVQSFRLDQLANAGAAKTLSNALNFQTWDWSGGYGASDVAFKVTGTNGTTSNGTLFKVTGNIDTLFQVVPDSGMSGSGFRLTAGGGLSMTGGTRTVVGNGAAITLAAQTAAATSNGDGGDVTISAGGADGTGTGGAITLAASNTGTNKGSVDAYVDQSAARLLIQATDLGFYGTGKTVLNQKHIYVDNTNGAPTISAGGGTGATIAGSDTAFEVVCGTGSPTSVTVTFANAHAAAPQIVLCATSQAGCRLNYAASTTTVQILSDTALSSGTKISCLVMGLQ